MAGHHVRNILRLTLFSGAQLSLLVPSSQSRTANISFLIGKVDVQLRSMAPSFLYKTIAYPTRCSQCPRHALTVWPYHARLWECLSSPCWLKISEAEAISLPKLPLSSVGGAAGYPFIRNNLSSLPTVHYLVFGEEMPLSKLLNASPKD